MRVLLQVISGVALAGAIAPPLFYLGGTMELGQTKLAMLIATIVWFAVAPFWVGQKAETV